MEETPNRRRLPLRAAEVFEAVVRRGSILAAARELFITPSAVSQQVKKFEERIGVPLFARAPGRLMPLPSALTLLPAITRALDLIDGACRDLAARENAPRLCVSVLPSVASRWLIPRIAAFRRAHPDINVFIMSEPELTDFGDGGADVALRYGRGDWPGLVAEKLMNETCAPLAAPAYFVRRPLRTADELPAHALIDDSSTFPGYHLNEWSAWLAKIGVAAPPREIVATMRDSHNALQLAVAGEGVVLGRSLIAGDEARAGRLENPLAFATPTELAYYLVYPPRHERRRAVRLFAGWLRRQINAHRRAVARFFPRHKTGAAALKRRKRAIE
jgi:LysR family glycine cleavage system transcriptional activator